MRDRKRPDREASNADESGVNLASANMTLAVTSRRLLIFKFGTGRSANPKFLLTDVPIGDVDSIVVGDSRMVTRPVTVTVHGESFELEVRRAVNTDTLISAFWQAKSGAPVGAAQGGLQSPDGPGRQSGGEDRALVGSVVGQTSAHPLPPADWYADPQHVARLRYWDGTRWTGNTAP